MKNSYFMRCFFVIATLFVSLNVFSQGSLLLIGGGSESDDEGAWNLEPYSWAVETAANHRVAILSFNSATSWMHDFFMEHCNAAAAKDFKINSSALANNQATYDSLMSYDMIFIKGGDQWNYYSTWKNTLTHQAIADKFNEGGVICGTSAGLAVLSEVIFTAQRGSVYPDECLQDPFNQYMTLADDFLNLFPGYIFDSHFTNRGRGARLVGFLANRYFNNDELLKGIGVDETTAMTISSDGLGTVYGTGAVNLYSPISDNPFHLHNGTLKVDSLRVDQLLHGCTYDFNTGTITGFSGSFNPVFNEEYGNYSLLMSGSDEVSENSDMLYDLVNDCGSADDLIVIVTGSQHEMATVFQSRLINYGAENVAIYSAIGSMQEDPDFARAIGEAKKILFLDNEYYILEHFMESGENGMLFYDRIRHDNMIVAFVGDNSRFAGPVVVENYLLDGAATNGTLTFKDGLSLLRASVIMPNSYLESDMYENAAAGVPYTLLQNDLRFGFWLAAGNYIKYQPGDQETTITCHGTFPVMAMVLAAGTPGGFASKTYNANYTTPAMIAGFQGLNLRILGDGEEIITGGNVSLYGMNQHDAMPFVKVFPNPVQNRLFIQSNDRLMKIIFRDFSGKVISEKYISSTKHSIDMSCLKAGIYLLEVDAGDAIRVVSVVKQ